MSDPLPDTTHEITYDDDRRYKLDECLGALDTCAHETLTALRAAKDSAERTTHQIEAARAVLIDWAAVLEQERDTR